LATGLRLSPLAELTAFPQIPLAGLTGPLRGEDRKGREGKKRMGRGGEMRKETDLAATIRHFSCYRSHHLSAAQYRLLVPVELI
jgi:hypothetical protein